jgi:hypothetical protein
MGERTYSAYVPDEFHLEGMREDGLPIPTPSSSAESVEVGEQAA